MNIFPITLISDIPPISQSAFLRLTKKSLVITLIALITLIPLGSLIFLFPKSASAAWFNDSWAFRQRIPIDTHTAAETNVYNEMTVDTAALTTDKLQADCDDLRFTKENGEILPYQITAGCDSASTTIRVGFDTMPIAPFNIYMYYGNPSAQIGSTTLTHTACGNGCAEGTAATEEKAPSPIHYWKFDEGYGTTAQDNTENNNDGTITGATWQTEDQCVSGKCLNFDGSDDDVADTTLAGGITSITTYITLSAWVRPTGWGEGNFGRVIQTENSSGTSRFNLTLDDDASGQNRTIRFNAAWTSGGTWTAPSDAISLNRWNFISVTYDGSSSSNAPVFYVNGRAYTTSTVTAASTTLSTDIARVLTGSNSADDRAYAGFIDEPKIFNYVRSAAQVQADYNARSNPEGLSTSLSSNIQNQPAALSSGLVGYWKMDHTTAGTAATDSSGNAQTLTDSGTLTYASGKFGNGGDFELGSTMYQYLADNSTLSLTGSLTLSAWIKPETVSAGSYNILGKWDGANESYRLFQNADEIRIEIDSAGNYVETSSSNLAAGSLYHVVGVYDASLGSAKIYINGVEATATITGTIPTSIADDGGRFHIGAEDSTGGATGYYDGVIDDARIYNRALSNNEVSQLYNFSTGPVASWNFEEKTGTTANDSSGNANTATLQNSAPFGTGRQGTAIDLTRTSSHYASGTLTPNITSSSYTISVWAYQNSRAEDQNIFSVGTVAGTDTAIHIRVLNVNGAIRFAQYANDLDSPAGIVNTGTWNHFSFVFDSNSGHYLYMNGIQVASNTNTTAFSGNSTFNIGRQAHNSTEYWNGKIDDLKVYNYARTSRQVVEDMNAGHPAPGSPAGSSTSYWKLDEGYGTTANDSHPTNNNDLTLSSSSRWITAGKFGKAWDGADNARLTRTDDADFDFANGTDDFSLSLWFNRTASISNLEYLLDKHATNDGYTVYMDSDGDIVCGIGDGAASFPEETIGGSLSKNYDDGVWHQAVCVKTGTSSLRLYVDGLEIASDTSLAVDADMSNAGDLYVGDGNGTDGTDEFLGDIDEIKFYRSALNSDQIKLDFNRGSSQSFGSLSSSQTNPNSAASEYCIPGDSSTCTAPVGRWDFEEKTGSTATDTSTNLNDLTLTNTPTYTRGKFGSGINFAGSDQHLLRADDGDFDSAAGGSYTHEVWFRHTTASAQELIVSKFNEAGYKIIMESDGDITCAIDYDSTWTPADFVTSTLATYDDGNWHQIACVKNANTSLTLYIDGISVGTPDTSLTNSTLENTDPIYLGIDADAASNDFIGDLDGPRIFNYARSNAQIAWDYNKGGPIGYWKSDECQGTSLNDSTGRGNTGTITIGATGSNTSAGTCSSPTDGTGAWYDGLVGKRNYSLDYDGTDDYVQTTSADLKTLNEFSISLWFNADATTFASHLLWEGQAAGNGGGDEDEMHISMGNFNGNGNDQLSFYLGSSNANTATSINASASFSDTTNWHQVTVVVTDMSGTPTATVYLDGNVHATDTGTTAGTDRSTWDTNMRFGRPGASSRYYDGLLDDIKIFPYALNATQIKNLLTDGVARYGPTTGAP